MFGRVKACMRDRILKECGAGQNRQSYICISLVLEDSVHLWLFLGRCIQLFSSNCVSWSVSEINFEAIDWWDTWPPNHNTVCQLVGTVMLGSARCINAWCRSASARPRIGEATYRHVARVGGQHMRLWLLLDQCVQVLSFKYEGTSSNMNCSCDQSANTRPIF